METLVGQAPIAIEKLLKSPSVTCLDPVVLELHLLDLELAHEDGEDGVEGDGEHKHADTGDTGVTDLVVRTITREPELDEGRAAKEGMQ